MIRNRDFAAAALLLCVALAFGGAGSYYPRLELLIELTSVAVLVWLASSERSWRLDALSTFALALAAGVILLPLLQLVPLPPQLWHQLPGRGFAAELDSQLGWSGKWRPLSLDPESTLRSAMILLPPVAMVVAVRFLGTRERLKLLRLFIAFAIATALIGGIQLASGGKLTPFPSAHLGYPIGLFVNRNHQATMLLIAIPIAAALGAATTSKRGTLVGPIATGLALIVAFSAIIVGTSSRMGSVLLVPAIGCALFIIFAGRRSWRIAVPLLVSFGLATVLILGSGVFNRLLARFSSLDDARFGYWRDVNFALQKFGLAGTGFGTFVPVYQSAEGLQHVSPVYLNHAHNDYLETALEGGFPAVALALLFVAYLALAIGYLLRNNASLGRRLMSIAAVTGIVFALLFSLVDYPLRMPALSVTFALLCGFLLPSPIAEQQSGAPHRRRRKGHRFRRKARAYAVFGSAAAVSWILVASATSEALIISEQYKSALAWAPWSASAHSRLAQKHLAAQELDAAAAEANAALNISPIQAAAISTIGIADLASGFAATGNRLMLIATSLGWRDPPAQLWAVQTALAGGQPDIAAQRTEALIRQGAFTPAMLSIFGSGTSSKALAELAHALAQEPALRGMFLKSGGDVQPAQFGTFAQVLEFLSHTSAGATPSEAQPFVTRLLKAGQIDAARRAWMLTRRAALVANGGFDARDSLPQGWSLSHTPGAIASVANPTRALNGAALRLYGASPATVSVSQLLLLGPGRYALTFFADESQAQGATLRWQIICLETKSALGLKGGGGAAVRGWRTRALQFDVPERNCPIQRVSAVWTVVLNKPSTLWIDGVSIARLAGDGKSS